MPRAEGAGNSPTHHAGLWMPPPGHPHKTDGIVSDEKQYARDQESAESEGRMRKRERGLKGRDTGLGKEQWVESE